MNAHHCIVTPEVQGLIIVSHFTVVGQEGWPVGKARVDSGGQELIAPLINTEYCSPIN